MFFLARVAAFFPVLFVTGIWGWSYYVYIVVLVANTIENVFVAAVFGLVFHILSFLFLAPYYRAVFEPISMIQSKFVLSPDEYRRLTRGEPCPDLKARNLPIKAHDGSGRLRLCATCKIIKPDRCRHCSICGQCVLKFDHHCPWVANCVGFHNYKFFFQFLAYASIFLIFVAATSVRYFIIYLHGDIPTAKGMHIAAMCFIAVIFLFSVGSLLGMHIHLLRRNETTVESMRRQPMFVRARDKFSLGSGTRNFYQVFGYNPALWFLPVHSSIGDGHHFAVQVDEEEAALRAQEQEYDPYNLNEDTTTHAPHAEDARNSTLFAVDDYGTSDDNANNNNNEDGNTAEDAERPYNDGTELLRAAGDSDDNDAATTGGDERRALLDASGASDLDITGSDSGGEADGRQKANGKGELKQPLISLDGQQEP